MGYQIALKYLADHNDTASPIAIVKGGKVAGILAMKDMGVFDEIQKRVFFEILRHHPWLVLRSLVYDKPWRN